MNNKTITVWSIALVLVGFAIGYAVFHRSNQNLAGAVSTPGTTNASSRIASIIFSPTTSTSTWILNSDSNDRVMKAFEAVCTGIGTSQLAYTGAGLSSTGLNIEVSTSSTNTASSTNTNYFVDQNMSITTTTPAIAYVASSSPGNTGTTSAATLLPALNRIWLAGSYAQIWTNATNTMSCNITIPYAPE